MDLQITGETRSEDAEEYYCEAPRSGIEPERLMCAARLYLLRKHPFWGKLAMSVVFIAAPSISTTAISARGRLYYNPYWVNGFDKKDGIFELAHEIMHLIQRLWDRAPKAVNQHLWNWAADIIADTTLIDMGLEPSRVSIEMIGPEEIALAKEHPTVPALYKYLVQEALNNEDCPGCRAEAENLKKMDKAGDGGDDPGESGTGCGHDHGKGKGKPSPKHTCGNPRQCCAGTLSDLGNATPQEAHKWLLKVVAAKEYAETQGNMPAALGAYIDSLTKSKVRWQDHVRTKATRAFGKRRYTYDRPNVLNHVVDTKLPGVVHESRCAIMHVDTSCSMSVKQVQQCISEGAALIRLCGGKKIWLILSDCKIGYSGWVELADLTKLKMGRGGTDHVVVFECLNRTHENKEFHVPKSEKVSLLISFTDLGTTFPAKAPTYDVIWGVPIDGSPGMRATVPFGKKVKVEMD